MDVEKRKIQYQQEALDLAVKREKQRQDAEAERMKFHQQSSNMMWEIRRERQQQRAEMERAKMQVMIQHPEYFDKIMEYTKMQNEHEEKISEGEIEYCQQEERMLQLEYYEEEHKNQPSALMLPYH